MDDVVFIQVQQCRECLLHHVAGGFLAEALALNDSVEQLASFQVLRDDEEVLVVLIKLQHFDDVGVVLHEAAAYQLSQDRDFLDQFLLLLIREVLLAELLHASGRF